MKTTFRAKQPYADILLETARAFPCESPARPLRFIRKMRENQGFIGLISGKGPDEEGLERKNPLIAALGDSVTAGHFESLIPEEPELARKFFTHVTNPSLPPDGFVMPKAIEVVDARESYIEKFREGLIDRFELTSVSVINSGIAGDNLHSMAARMQRDVIRYQPDLVLINGSLNWDVRMGTTEAYRELLRGMVRRLKAETEADIILLTPNGDLPNNTPFMQMMGNAGIEPTTGERAEAIRRVAAEEQVCLADVYAVWEAARAKGCPWKELLANGVNHPGVEGHETYAIVLMKLFEE